MKHFLLAAALTLTAAAPTLATEAGNGPRINTNELANQILDLNQVELQTAPIRSAQDLHTFAVLNRGRGTPLDAFTSANRRVFLDSVTFNEKGVTGFNYAPLKGLTASQAYALLKLFGVQHLAGKIEGLHVETELDRLIVASANESLMAVDHEGYYCASRGSCGPRFEWICTGNC